MRSFIAILLVLAPLTFALDKPLNIDVTYTPPKCNVKSTRGSKVGVHYRGTLGSDGSEFDSSYNRGQPLEFKVGNGQVIKGWDEGLLDMCPGEKRTLTIQPEWAYGQRAMGTKIPANSVLVFDTEMITVDGKGVEEQKEEL